MTVHQEEIHISNYFQFVLHLLELNGRMDNIKNKSLTNAYFMIVNIELIMVTRNMLKRKLNQRTEIIDKKNNSKFLSFSHDQ